MSSTSPAPGERRQATVLFSDLSGFTSMSERLDPEEVTGIMGRFKAEAERIVSTHGGTVNQFVGDEVFALFGIPTAHEDDPARAVRAALELHEAVRALSDEIEARLGETLRLHSGINTGLVVTAPGDGTGGRYTVTGDTVNTAARMVSRAETDRILVGDATRRQVAPFYDLEELEPVTVKGKARPLVPYRVLGASGVASRFEAAEARGFTPYTGREADRATLHEALERTTAGEGQFITVSGEAGLGKSRLLYEFRREIDRDTVTVLQGRCQSFGQATPYLPFTNALRRGLGLRDEDTPAQQHAKTVASLRAIDPTLEESIPVLLHLLSIPSEEHPLPEHLSGEALRRASQEALAAMNLCNARRRPMVLILEDWHWVDEASDAALRHLLTLLGGSRLMVVVNFRPEFDASWRGAVNHQHLTLGPLSDDHTAIITKAVLEATRLPEGLGELIHQRTGGNPFFIEEMCLDLLEEGIVLVKDGQAALTRPAEKLELPGTVQAVIRSRLDRLSEAHQDILRLASVIGREFDCRLLAQTHAATTENGGDIVPLVEVLIAQGLIQQVRVLPEPEYIFRHVLTQVVVYETLLIERRKSLHELVGRTLEELYADRLEEHYEALAFHFRNSAGTEKATRYLELAGDKAASYFSLVVAREHYREAIRLVDATEINPERMTIRIDLSLSWAAVAFYSPSEEIINVLETSLNFAEQIQDETRLAKVIYWMGRTQFSLGDIARALPFFDRCIGIAESLADKEILAFPYNIMGRSYLYTAEYTKGIEYLEKGIPMMERLGNMDEVAYSTCILASIHCWIGNFRKGFALAERAQEIANDIGNLTREALTQTVIGFGWVMRGDWAEALTPFDRTMEISRQTGNVLQAGYGMGFKGFPTFMLGQRDEGIELMKEGGKLIEATGSHLTLGFHYGWLAESYAASGHIEDAILYAGKVLDLGLVSDKAGEAVAHRALAVAASLETPLDWGKVEKPMAESLRISQERGELPNLAIGYFRYAEIRHKKGDMLETREELDRAAALFADMGMTWWADQSEALRGRIERGEPFRGFAPYAE